MQNSNRKKVNRMDEYFKHLIKVQNQYIKQEKTAKICLKIFTFGRALLLASIPVVICFDVYSNEIIIVITAILAFLEFLTNFFDYDKKLILLNEALCDINYQYYSYIHDLGIYKGLSSDECDRLFVEETLKISDNMDKKTNNKYNMDAINKMKPKQ